MSPKPAFFIVCGDLVDAFPDKWPEIRSAQEKDFFKVFSKLNSDIPLVCVCGNHDVGKNFFFNFLDLFLLHFVAFFHVASLFSTGVENSKAGVENALELDKRLSFHISA